jgi:single-stranded DNA-binding protein
MTYTAEGLYMGNQIKECQGKKDPSQTFLAGDVLIEIDNSWSKRNGERVVKKSVVPFNAFGDTAKAAQLFKFGEAVSVSYEIEGREYTDKNGVKRHSVQLKAFFFNKKEEADNIPFGNDAPESSEKMPWDK